MAGKHFERELVQGFLHEPASPAVGGLAITHGAGSSCEAPLLIAIAEAFAGAGFYVLRFDLPYRQQGKSSPPLPAHQGKDREGIRRAVDALREIARSRIFLGGHSYGGRQSTMLAAEDRTVADALLLLSYPLHPPRKPEQLRTAHFPKLETPALFVHGARDPFGSVLEMHAALVAIPARTELIEIAGAPHGLSTAIAPGLPHQFGEFLAR